MDLFVLLGLHHLIVVCLFFHNFFVLLLLFTLASLIQFLLATARSLEDLIDLFHALVLKIALHPENDGLAITDSLLKFIARTIQPIELRNGSECPFDEATSEDTGLKFAVKLVIDLIEVSLLLEFYFLVFSGGKLFLYFFLEFDALFPRAIDEALALVEENALLRHHLAESHLQVILEAILKLQSHVIRSKPRLIILPPISLLSWLAVQLSLLHLVGIAYQ